MVVWTILVQYTFRQHCGHSPGHLRLEGTLSGVGVVSIFVFDISGNVAGEGLRGPLPQHLCRAKALQYLMTAHNSLIGATPPLPANTLEVLALQSNKFTSCSAINLLQKDDKGQGALDKTLVLLYNNRLSCKLNKKSNNAGASPSGPFHRDRRNYLCDTPPVVRYAPEGSFSAKRLLRSKKASAIGILRGHSAMDCDALQRSTIRSS